ncbi:alginate lyase family protein [Pseudomonas sp. SWRI154]|uniref:alginate lyase family protein n=1 Tax=Pseudomonas sp. SWRI154 TaxID=2745501 RepID=UPI001648FD72|nr:alginate lyase family protein [Pseudomonas sp. SWRI154]MBC3364992.1 alginate lyase family protein [Pseudomonas sp. SWRI154]
MKKIIGYVLFSVFIFTNPLALGGFTHPGVLVGSKQLQYVRDNLSREPWRTAYEETMRDPLANLEYVPKPWATVECGSYSDPNHGCSDEMRDAQAAYTQALLWRLNGDVRYAENVRKILNAWADTLTGGHIDSNAPLQAAWAAELFTRAAEIVKYTYSGWPQPEKDKVTRLFASQYYPDVLRAFSGGYACNNKNWHASAIEAMFNIAVFNKNQSWLDDAVARWRSLVPSYIYLSSDGARPKDASWCPRNNTQINAHWSNPEAYVEGMTQESCRDFEHTAYGLAAIINVAESAHLQGIDLYGDQTSQAASRIAAAMELHSAYQNGEQAKLCKAYDGHKNDTVGTFDIGFNHYALRQGVSLPQTWLFLQEHRPVKGKFHYLWETLTHGSTGIIP